MFEVEHKVKGQCLSNDCPSNKEVMYYTLLSVHTSLVEGDSSCEVSV